MATLSESTPLVHADDKEDKCTTVSLLMPTMGDLSCFFALFMNNLGTVIATAGLGKLFLLMPFSQEEKDEKLLQYVNEVVFFKIIPGMVPTILVGCVYYSWMAVRELKSKAPGTTMTALPYGINTPAAIMFIVAIMGPVCIEAHATGVPSSVAVDKALAAGIVANFVGGLISMACALVGPQLVQATPPAALMIALAGIGFTWLGVAPLLDCFSFSMCGLVTIVLGLLLQLGVVRTGLFPPTVILLACGICLGWGAHFTGGHSWEGGGTVELVEKAKEGLGFYYPLPISAGVLSEFSEVMSTKLGVIIPVAFTGAIGTLLNVKAAEAEGDTYPLRETLLIDGATTCLSALFGSPYGTCVFIGHPQYKQMGGRVMYPVFFGIAFAVLAMSGACELINAVVPLYAVQPIILFIGLMIVSDAFATSPKRHLPACVLGLFPALADLVMGLFPQLNGATDSKTMALKSLANGALMIAILWTAIIVHLIDCRFIPAAIWCMGGAALSAIGMIHQPKVDLSWVLEASGLRALCLAAVPASSCPGPAIVYEHVGTRPLDFVLGYSACATVFFCLGAVQMSQGRLALVPPPYEESVDAEKEAETAEHEAARLSKRVSDRRKSMTMALPPVNEEKGHAEP